jgi:hypothetical protein
MSSRLLSSGAHRKRSYPGFGSAATELPHLDPIKDTTPGQSAALELSSSAEPQWQRRGALLEAGC